MAPRLTGDHSREPAEPGWAPASNTILRRAKHIWKGMNDELENKIRNEILL